MATRNPNIMLVGLLGSGKTTLANHLTEKYKYQQVVSPDTIHTNLRTLPLLGKFFQIGETNIKSFSYKSTQVITKVIQAFDIIIKSRSQNGLVYDACNLQVIIRKTMHIILGNRNTKIIFVQADEEEIIKRLNVREKIQKLKAIEAMYIKRQKEGEGKTWLDLHKEQKETLKEEGVKNPDMTYDNTHVKEGDFSEFDKKFEELVHKHQESSRSFKEKLGDFFNCKLKIGK